MIITGKNFDAKTYGKNFDAKTTACSCHDQQGIRGCLCTFPDGWFLYFSSVYLCSYIS